MEKVGNIEAKYEKNIAKALKEKPEDKATAEKKPEGKKTADKKPAKAAVGKPAKAPAKKPAEEPVKKQAKTKAAPAKAAAKKVQPSVNIELQYLGKAIKTEDLIASVKKYVKGNKEINIYIKPEENRAYYVCGADVGSFEI